MTERFIPLGISGLGQRRRRQFLFFIPVEVAGQYGIAAVISKSRKQAQNFQADPARLQSSLTKRKAPEFQSP
jgi:hypothetical protein